MPPGTDSGKVLAAVKNLCREEFGLKHRYAMALHTDEPHPHVHVLVKAMSEQGERLHIRKEILRRWRLEFARHLRAVGVSANATQRYVRGVSQPRKPDRIYRAMLRGESTHMSARATRIVQESERGGLRVESGKAVLANTRNSVRRAWNALGDSLIVEGKLELGARVKRFSDQLPPPLTEKEYLHDKIFEHSRGARAR